MNQPTRSLPLNRVPKSLTLAVTASLLFVLSSPAAPPDDFPKFQVPGHEKEMDSMRDLFWLHYPGAGPKATLWDEWLPDASLWPGVSTNNQSDAMRQAWASTLTGRIMDPEGYVATHQHQSIAHQLGWPFPFWNQGRRGFGWHFSFKDTIGPNWRPHDLSKPDNWKLDGAVSQGVNEEGWAINVTNADAVVTPPPWKCHTFEVPFVQLRWQSTDLGNEQPYLEWTTPSATNFTSARRIYFEPAKPGQMTYTMIPAYRDPQWTGEVAQIRIGLGNSATGNITIQALFSQYDTRHNINSQNFIRGCAKYFWWTRDLNFLRANINRMRTALRYDMTEHHTLERKVIYTDWVGHDGRSGLERRPNGEKIIHTGEGIGNDYWDILPFGGQDAYATIQYYDAVRTMAEIEREIRRHPEWLIPGGVLAFDPAILDHHAAEVKTVGNKLFWNPKTERFNACIDADGKTHDYGFTFLNLEAIYYDFATSEHAKEILSWINGDRNVAGDTSQGADIYHWRFGPRSTTLRNLDWYFWAWNSPESIPWGGQVQDGGAVLGFSYHDLMARLKVLGPDNAWKRLQQILTWFDEVQAAGGYRKYYNGTREGSMQGAGTAGGLGLDMEFFESAMVPQIMLNGFMGFKPRADGFKIDPRLPSDWPELTIDHIRFQNMMLTIRATHDTIELRKTSSQPLDEPMDIYLPEGNWKMAFVREDGSVVWESPLEHMNDGDSLRADWSQAPIIRLKKN